jgi:phage shock protein A
MGIFSRISDIFTANLNALLDRAENPELMLSQMIREMEDGLAQARRYAAVAIAAENRLRRDRDDNQGRVEQWKARAREALAAGQEELAWRALAQKQEHEVLARSLNEEHAEAVQAAQSARTALEALEARLAEARRKQRVLVARHRTAQVRVEVYRHLDVGRLNFGASQARFDRLADRLSQRVEELAAEAELCDLSGLEAEFSDLERRVAIEQELEAMKREGKATSD